MIKKIIIIAIIAIAAIVSIKTIHTNINSKTGTEWFEEQGAYVSNMETWASQLDDVTALYINGNISQDDYMSHIDLLEKELALMKADYSVSKENVKIGSYSELEKMGCDSVEECFSVMGDMIDMVRESSGNPDELSYNYIAFQQKLIYAIEGYAEAISTEEQGEFLSE